MGRPSDRQDLGRRGEEIACEHLREQGFEIVARNWRSRRGEIDIVARIGGLTAFVEVKARTGDAFGAPEESVTPAKARRLKMLAGEYLSGCGGTADIRFDVVSIILDLRGEAVSFEHIPDAF